MTRRVQKRGTLSDPAPPPLTLRHAGEAAVPLVVTYTSPVSCATHTRSELPSATAIALMLPASAGLMARQTGPRAVVLGAFASSVRQSERPPASRRRDWLGSSTNGAMNSAR